LCGLILHKYEPMSAFTTVNKAERSVAWPKRSSQLICGAVAFRRHALADAAYRYYREHALA
jgi:hypothetical protein